MTRTQQSHETMTYSPEQARLRLWLRLLKAQRRIEASLRDRLRSDFGSTLPRFDVLAALNRVETGLRMSELSGVLKVSNGNVTGIVDRLVEDGMVIRMPVENDRRAMRVRLTRKGREHFAELATAHKRWVSDLMAEFAPDEANQLSDALDTLNQTLEAVVSR